MVSVGKAGDQLAVLEGRCRKTVKQEYDWRVGWAGFAVEDGYAVGLNAMDGGARDLRALGHSFSLPELSHVNLMRWPLRKV